MPRKSDKFSNSDHHSIQKKKIIALAKISTYTADTMTNGKIIYNTTDADLPETTNKISRNRDGKETSSNVVADEPKKTLSSISKLIYPIQESESVQIRQNPQPSIKP